MEVRLGFLISVTVILTIVDRFNSVSASCHFSVVDDDKLYNYTLDSPIPFFPHGVQSEDGYSLSLSLSVPISLAISLLLDMGFSYYS